MILVDTDKSIKFLKCQPFITVTNGTQIDCGKHETSSFMDDVLYALPLTKNYLMKNKNLFLENDVLTLYCECSWSDGFALEGVIERIDYGILSPPINKEVSTKSCSPSTEVSHFDKMLDLKEDFHYLYAEGIFSDVKLRATTQTFHAHKNILSVRSPVFRAMLTTDMKEKIQECVDIPDLEDDTVRRMLLYMYTNALEDLQWESALKLYAAADKYEIFALKSKCCSFLKCNLCPNNLCDVLVLADMHVDSDLKEAAQVYAFEHEQEVFQSSKWILFAKTNPALASETMLLKWNKH
ncbi:hypothetical protein TNIN_366041 [Trichonephila inaurata madagascariensis]|uniref:BTB domain-containing protein n=1 Tax=Trichonephila inaurata madagascariensis TaxID=2747483 RepID=A0A8X6MK75_9ARAC|nr:hypothetical protein TNIN_366041 [Trichonephila inaurata madagascariensis]